MLETVILLLIFGYVKHYLLDRSVGEWTGNQDS